MGPPRSQPAEGRFASQQETLVLGTCRIPIVVWRGDFFLADAGVSTDVGLPHVERHARLLAGARDVRARNSDAAAALDGLIDFHLDFALGEPDLIRIQDRDLAHLPEAAEKQVRKAQRQYVEVWVGVLRELNPELPEADARLTAHAVFGLLNSTPHSMKSPDTSRSRSANAARSHAVMRAMTVAALAAGNECP
ncbi:MAG: TetR/AcrR family transcriptional regulator [Mycobacterium sp.]